MLHQVGVSFDLYYDERKHKIKKIKYTLTAAFVLTFRTVHPLRFLDAVNQKYSTFKLKRNSLFTAQSSTYLRYVCYVFVCNNMCKVLRSNGTQLRIFPFHSCRQPDDGCAVWPKHVAVF